MLCVVPRCGDVMIDEALLDELDAQPWGPFVKGWPLDGRFTSVADVRARRPRLVDAGLVTPYAVVDADALEHNLALMARFCRDRRVVLAPHGKTTMTPRLFARQVAAGAWGITVATPYQLAVAWRVGVERILLANELTDPGALVWLGRELERAAGGAGGAAGGADGGVGGGARDGAGGAIGGTHDGPAAGTRRVLSYVDDPGEVDRARSLLEAASITRPLDVLIELGHDGGRAGCRSLEVVREVARRVVASPVHRLVGIAGYEGTLGASTDGATMARVASYLDVLVAGYRLLRDEGLLEVGGGGGADRPVVSAGGSIYFDAVSDAVAGLHDEDGPLVILRSGGYAAHDDVLYRDTSPFSRGADPAGAGLVAALEVHSRVLSRPEPGLVIIDAGRRDVPFDAGLPVVRAVWRQPGERGGEPRGGAGRDAVAPGALQVEAVNDQHGFVRVDPGLDLVAGDVLVLGISHPCTLFDKWRVLPVVSGDRVVDALRTWF